MGVDRCDLLCLDLPRAEELRGRLDTAGVPGAAARARALADPTRLTVALTLREGGELCVCDLSWILAKPPNLVSHHVRALRAAGLTSARRDGKMVMYALTAAGASLVDAVTGAEVLA